MVRAISYVLTFSGGGGFWIALFSVYYRQGKGIRRRRSNQWQNRE